MPYNLNLTEALSHLQAVEQELTPTKELAGIDPDTAFLLGYQTALFELSKVTGPPPMLEVGLITYYKKDEN